MSEAQDSQKSVFLSYRRRVGWQSARLVYSYLSAHDYDVFMDVESLGSGAFPPVIEHQIEARPHFVIVLNPGTLASICEENDWLRREIAHAIRSKRNIVPLLFDRFSFDDQEIRRLAADVDEIGTLSQQNGVNVPSVYFNEAMAKLCAHFLRRTGGMITPTPPEERMAVDEMLVNAKRADEAMGALPKAITPERSAYDYAFVQNEGGHGSWFEVPVFYATDRSRRALSWKPDHRFAGDRSRGGNLWLGRTNVSIPQSHRISALERPSWLQLAFKEDRSKHVVI